MTEVPDGSSTTYGALLADPRLLVILLLTSTGGMTYTAVPVTLPYINRTLAVSDARIGLVMTVFFIASGTSMFFVGSLADMYGRRAVVLPSLLIFGTSSTAVLFVDSFAVLLALRAVQGMSFPAITPLSTALLGDIYSGTAGTTAQGMKSSAAGVAGLVSPVVAGVLAGIGWQYPFLVGALAFPTFVLVYRYLPESAPNSSRRRPRSLRRDAAHHLRRTRLEVGDADLQTLFLIAGLGFGLRTAYSTFLPLFAVRELGAGAFTIGLLLAVFSVGKIPVAPLSGWVVTHVTRRHALGAVFAVIAVVAALLPLASSVVVLGLLVVTYSIADALFTPILNDTVVTMATPDRRSSVVTVNSVFKNIGSATTPAAFGLLLAVGGFVPVFLLIGGLGAVASVVCLTRIGAVEGRTAG